MKIPVLDHGYVEFIEAWGHGQYAELINGLGNQPYEQRDMEAGIIEAARQSTQGSFRGWDKDQKLLTDLFNYKPQHAGPFEFAGLVIEVQAPILVFREWHRHRTQSYNEMSARYAPLPDLYYLPGYEETYNRAMQGWVTKNKQEAGMSKTEPELLPISLWLDWQAAQYKEWQRGYEWGLEIGIPKEIARIGMPVGHYSRMRAQATLRNWLAFLLLRLDPAAQWEIRQFASAVGQIIAEQFPRTWKLFEEKKNV